MIEPRSRRQVLNGRQVSVSCWNDGHDICTGTIRLWRTGNDAPCLCPCHQSTDPESRR